MGHADFQPLPIRGAWETEPPFFMEDESNEKVINSVIRDFDKAKNRRAPYEEVWDRCYKLYNSYVEPLTDDDWHSNIFISKCFSLVETELPRIVMATVASRDFFGVLPVSEEETDRSKLVKNLITFQLNDEINILLKWIDYLKQKIIYGNSPGKVYWKRQTETRKITQEINLFFKILRKEISKEVPVYDGPQFDFVDLYDFFPALPTVSNVEDQPYIIHRTFRDLNYLEDVQEQAGYDPETIRLLKEKEAEGGNVEDVSQRRLSEIGISIGDENSGRLEIVERWKRGKISTIENTNKLFLREIDYPYTYIKYPFIFSKHTPIPGEFYGKGIIEPNADAQFLLNELVNNRMDNVKVIIHKIFTWLEDSGTNPEGIVSGPMSIIPVENHDDLKELEISDVTASSYREQGVVSETMQETSGIWPYSQGQAPQRKETASGIISLQQAAEVRFQLVSLMFQDSGIKELVKKVHALNRQFLPDEKKIRILGREGLKFITLKNKNEIDIDCDFVPVGHPTMGNKQLRLQQVLLVGQYLAGRGNQYEVDRMVLEAAEIENVDDIIGPSPKDRLDPMQENQILATGEFIDAHQYDPHDQHIPVHIYLLQSQELNADLAPLVANHIRQHKLFLDAVMQQRQRMMQMSAMGGGLGNAGDIIRPTGAAEIGERPAPIEEMNRRNLQ